nr:MAG TPA: hypothetical protein [Caudoviricetes sp.]
MVKKSVCQKTKPRFGGAFCLSKIAGLVFNQRNRVWRIGNHGIKTGETALYHWSDIVTFVLGI